MTGQPSVSIIMNCYNSAQYLREAIDSIYAQTYTDWEIIFWDNASSDNSAEIARSYDQKLKYFRGNETVSIGRARNLALAKTQGQYLAFLDCDDIWLPDKLKKQVPLFEKNHRIGLVYCDTIFFNNTGKKRQLYKNQILPRGNIFRVLLRSYFLSMETVMIRKKALDTLSEWFDERFNVNEEADLFIRLAHDWEADFVAEPLAMWRMHAKSLTYAKKWLFPQELKMQLEKYRRIFPDFNIAYKDEAHLLEAKIQYQLALLEWEKGNGISARKGLRPYLALQKKYLVPYFFSFLPYRVYKLLLSIKYPQI